MMEKLKKLMDKYGGELQAKLRDPIFFIKEIIELDLTAYQEEWIKLIEDNDRLNITAFRQSGKTEVFYVCYPIFKAFTQAGWVGVIISKSLPQAMEVVKRIKERVTESDILRTSIPSTREADWSKTQIEFKNGSRIICKPCNPNIRGLFADFVGGDEIGEWTDQDMITKAIPPLVLSRDGKICFIGTPISEMDMIHQLRKNKAYVSKIYPANLKDDAGKTLWEMRYPTYSMSKKRLEYDSLSWSREFLCKPLSSKDKIYPYDLIAKSFDHTAPFTTIRNNRSAYYIGLDFALSGAAGADYTVYSVLEKQDDVCRLVNMERYKGLSFQAQKARIIQLSELYRPIKVIADEGSFGKAFIQDLRAEGINVDPFRFTNESKQSLHTNLRNMFEQNRVIINRDESHTDTKQITDLLINEFSKFGVIVEKGVVKFEGLGEHDDMVTSMALSCWMARGTGNVCWHVARGSNVNKGGLIFLGKIN